MVQTSEIILAREFLNSAYQIERRVKILERQIMEAEALALKITPTIKETPGAARQDSKVESAAVKAADYQKRLQLQLDYLINAKLDIEATIASIADTNQRDILRMRYLLCMGWEAIARNMNYSSRHVFRVHENAIITVASMRAYGTK